MKEKGAEKRGDVCSVHNEAGCKVPGLSFLKECFFEMPKAERVLGKFEIIGNILLLCERKYKVDKWLKFGFKDLQFMVKISKTVAIQ